jgi:hypothetical protein
MASDQFVEWLEGKVIEAGATKVIPDRMTLFEAFRESKRLAAMDAAAREAATRFRPETVAVPTDLEARVRRALELEPGRPWDEVLADIAQADTDDA